MKLLTRDDFREFCLDRDKHKCIVCGSTLELSVHHLIERCLFSDGGYYLDNGVTVCPTHHLEAEETVLSCQTLRDLAKIASVVVPEHLPSGEQYDKWGNIILDNGQRMPGELFYQENVQKILGEGNVLHLFIKYLKYPRTFHLPWSPGRSSDDKVLSSTNQFENKEVIVTVKMDGENCTFYDDFLHARSINSQNKNHSSRDFVKQIHGQIKSDIPKGWRICGENMYAKHAIFYENLPSFFLVFSIWNDKNTCLSWDETLEWIELLGLSHVPVLYRGLWNENTIKSVYQSIYQGNSCEGYVVRLAEEFSYREFKNCVAKYVREGHVLAGSEHWLNEVIIPNKVKI